MKDIIIFKARFLLLIFVFLPLLADAYDQMSIRLNGHAYLVDDIFSMKIKETYENSKQAIKDSVEEEMQETQNNKLENIKITLPDNISIEYSFNSNEETDTLVATLERIKIKFVHKDYTDCDNTVKFDLKVKYLMRSEIDSLAMRVNLDALETVAYNVDVQSKQNVGWYAFWADWFCAVFEWAVENFGNVDGKIEKEISKALVDTTFKVVDFLKFNDGQAVDPEELAAVENSFPINGCLSADLNGNLIIDVNFLEGESGQYKNIIPDAVLQNNKLDIGGFSFLWPSLENGYEWQDSWNNEQRIDAAFDKMAAHEISGCRVEARWDKFQPSSDVTLGGNPNNITDNAINQLMANGAVGWDTLAYILDKADEKGIIVFIALGVGHDSRPPGTPANSGSMAPDESGSFNETGFIAVTADDYLYNLKLYARAVVRKFKNRVGVWQIENELNAARFAQSFDWWRKGSLWREDQPGGFQDKVWNILVDAVRTEDPRSKITHDFHMLDIEDRLQRWGADLDIIGVNFYPNQLFAYPVLGFAVGEYVWAVRRMLKGLNMSDKPVWVIETGYPAKTAIEVPEPYSVNQDVMHFSEKRQQSYIEDAINSGASNGAKGFFYYSLTTDENEGDASTPELNKYIKYAGLIHSDAANSEKIAMPPFGNSYVSNYPGIGQTRLINKYGSVNIGGEVSLKGERDYMTSGDTTWAVKEIKHTARTELEKTTYNNIKIKHHDWDNNTAKWKMEDNNFNIINVFELHNAHFSPTNTGVLTIKTNLLSAGGSSGGKIKFKDPWFVENDQQLNQFKEYNSPFTPGGGGYAYYDGIFLNQSLIEPSHYEIYAAPEQDIPFHNQNIKWYFKRWKGDDVDFQNSGQNETAVVFKAANAEARALYKGHLASNHSRATGHNNGRRLARDDNGNLHLVYEDNGSIYYTTSADEGENWDAEKMLASSSGYVKLSHPSISIFENRLFIVWTYNDVAFETYYVRFNEYDLPLNNTSNSHLFNIHYPLEPNTKEPAPSVAVLIHTENEDEYFPVVAVDYYDTDNSDYFIKIFMRDYGVWSEMANSPLQGKNPSL